MAFLGKILFCLVDILVGWLLFKIALTRLPLNVTIKKKLELLSESKWAVALFWLFNPLTVVISARGNADCVVCAAVILTIYLLRKNQVSLIVCIIDLERKGAMAKWLERYTTRIVA